MEEDPEKEEREALEALRVYLLACPTVSAECRAMRAALASLDAERKKMDRDAKLRQKFTASQTTPSTTTTTTTNNNAVVKLQESLEPPTARDDAILQQDEEEEGNDEDCGEDMEWQDVAPPTHDSPLGKQLSEMAIARMASAGTGVSTPLAAVALGLHAALLSPTLQFKCTGIPDDDSSSKSSAFAAPIRELPKTLFVPPRWDALPSQVTLRYRKDGYGTAILRVTLQINTDNSEEEVCVTLAPPGEAEARGQLTFPLARHINLDSLTPALTKSKLVPPALHYKGLSILLTNFCRTLDLGTIHESSITPTTGAAAEAFSTMTSTNSQDKRSTSLDNRSSSSTTTTSNVGPPPIGLPTTIPMSDRQSDLRPPSFFDSDQGLGPLSDNMPPRRGDFNGDLMPGGIVDPRFMGIGGMPGSGHGGNLMGPNHPHFTSPPDEDETGFFQQDDPSPLMPGGLGMRPRFDPFGPPGGPMDPRGGRGFGGRCRGRGRGRGRVPPGGSGDPNPDHQRPPNDYFT